MIEFDDYVLEDFISSEKRSLISGPFGSSISKKFFQTDGVPVIRGINLSTGFIKFIDDGFAFVTEEKAKSLNTYAVIDDLVFTAVGTLGQVGIIHDALKYDEYIISNKQLRVRLNKEKLDPNYAFYWFSSPWMVETIKKRNVGSTVPLINLTITRNLPVRIPKNISIQKAIVKVLSDLDAKIELNNKINTELEAMAKLIYDFWFVQFDFPDENGKPYKSYGGKMVYNKALKREIPEGWEVESLNTLLDYNSGHSFSSKSYCESGKWKIVTIKAVQENGFDTSKCDKIKELPLNLDAECNLEIGDLLMSLTGNTGRLCFVTETNCLLNQRVAKIWSSKLSNYFIYLYFKRPEKQKLIEQLSSGSSQANLSPLQLFKTKDLIPENTILNSFEDKVEPIFQRILVNEKENQKLAELRDWLLPMLMNGQVRVN